MMRSIFVSSTFRDMHHERDILHTKVQPAVNALAQKYGESVAMCDLRWGINTADMTEQDSAGKVLNVCLSEIDRCRPYMIVILGYRYGWIPGEEMIHRAIREKDDFKLSDCDISVTALEVEYGALADVKDIRRTLFYFREIDGACEEGYLCESPVHQRKLQSLKERIRAIPGSHVRSYRVRMDGEIRESMDEFADMVIGDLKALLQREWEESAGLDAYALDQKTQWGYLQEKNAQFIARTALLEQCLAELRSNRSHLLLHGAPGSGKSTLMSRLGHVLQRSGNVIIPIFCGYTPLCSAGFDLLRYIAWELERLLGMASHFTDTAEKAVDSAAWLEYIDLLLKRYDEAPSGELIFLIDGTDQLICDGVAEAFSFVPRETYAHVRFVCSMVSPDKLPAGLSCIEVKDLPAAERKQVVRGILHSKHRELSDRVVEWMVNLENARLPLYLSLVVQRLLMMDREDFQHIARLGDGMDAITAYQLKLVEECPPTLEELSVHVLKCAAGRVGGNAILELVELLAVSRRGLRMSDLEGLARQRNIPCGSLDVTAFVQYMGSVFLYRRDGRLDFAHKSIREGFLARCRDLPRRHEQIGRWLYQLPDADEVRRQEVVWHLIQADQKQAYADAVAGGIHDEVNIPGMTKDTVDAVLRDDGKWLMDVIRTCFMHPAFGFLSHFVNYHVFFGIPNTRHNLDVKRRISELMLEAAQKRCAVEETHGNIWEITVACDRLAVVHQAYETRDHEDFAIRCLQNSLKIRKRLLDMYQKLDTVDQMRRHWDRELVSAGIGVQQTLTAQHLQQMTDTLVNEVYRGICVAYEDMAKILHTGDRERQLTALEYMHNSLSIRQRMYSSGQGRSFTEDEEVELSRILGMTADICLSLKEPQYIREAEQHCASSLEICQASLRRGRNDARLEALCTAYIRLANLYVARDGDGGIEKALELCMKCVPILETIDIQRRSAASQTHLADIYNRIGDLYAMRPDPASQAQAEGYYRKSFDLLRSASVNNPSLEARRNLVVVAGKRAVGHTPGASESGLLAYREARRILEEIGSQAACDQLNGVLESLIQTVKADGEITPEVRERILAELEICRIGNVLKIRDKTEDQIRQCVVRYAKIAEALEKMTDLTEDAIPPALMERLRDMELSSGDLNTPGMERAYRLSKKIVSLSEYLADRTKEPGDEDMLAVSLSKHAGLCLQCGAPEWGEVNEKMLKLANDLYRRTKREKYLQMIAMGEMGRRMMPQTTAPTPKKAPPTPAPDQAALSREIRNLQLEMSLLEMQRDALPGDADRSVRENLENQIHRLRQKIGKLKQEMG